MRARSIIEGGSKAVIYINRTKSPSGVSAFDSFQPVPYCYSSKRSIAITTGNIRE